MQQKNKIEHNEQILRGIWNRIMIEIWSIIPTSLLHTKLYVLQQFMWYANYVVIAIIKTACSYCTMQLVKFVQMIL